MSFVQLKSCDDEVFRVDLQVAKQSHTLKTMIDDLGNPVDGFIVIFCLVDIEFIHRMYCRSLKLLLMFCWRDVSLLFFDLFLHFAGIAGEQDEIIPLLNVKADILRKVIAWCTYHKDDVVDHNLESREKRSDDVSSWDAEFMDVDRFSVFELTQVFVLFFVYDVLNLLSFHVEFFSLLLFINFCIISYVNFSFVFFFFMLNRKAANFLDIKGLFDVACKTIAKMIKGKSAQEIREIFDIENDLEDQK